ncbi:MAG: glycosyl hydrolase, partial [Acidobacteria bacterium]
MKRRLPARLLASLGLSVGLLWIGVDAQAPQRQAQAPAGQVTAVQGTQPAPALPPQINVSDDPLLKPFRFRSIGPASMGGRIDDIAAVESDPSTIYVGFATGGLWKTTNNGTTWIPIFDTYSVCSIGAVAVDQRNPNIVWVGTGEANNRQSSSFGDGVYKSTDAGKTFTHVGLKETQSIARIVVDPRDSNTVYVAAIGHLFAANPERGLFKTTDGGKTW